LYITPLSYFCEIYLIYFDRSMSQLTPQFNDDPPWGQSREFFASSSQNST